MKAIRTRYYGATNTRPSKIVATDGDHNRLSMSYDHDLTSDDGHRKAAYALRDKMQWRGELIGGGFKNDMYWVFQT